MNLLIPVGVQDFELFHSDLEQSVDHQSRYRDMVLSSLQLSSSRQVPCLNHTGACVSRDPVIFACHRGMMKSTYLSPYQSFIAQNLHFCCQCLSFASTDDPQIRVVNNSSIQHIKCIMRCLDLCRASFYRSIL